MYSHQYWPYSNLAGSYASNGRLGDAERTMRKLLELSTSYYGARGQLGNILLLQGKPASARDMYEQEEDPIDRKTGLIRAAYALGDIEESDRLQTAFQEEYGDDFAGNYATTYAFRGDVEEAFRWIDVAVANKSSWLGGLRNNVWLANIQDDPRYLALLEELGLAD